MHHVPYLDAPVRVSRAIVRRALALALCLALLCAGAAPRVDAAQRASAPAGGATYRNPVFAQDFPDPMVLRVSAHSYYAYGTTAYGVASGYEPLNHVLPILHSTDLVHWRYAGDVFRQPPGWATGDFWAPDVVSHNGTYYVYYVGLRGSHCVAVATGKTPTGPFTTRDVVGCGDARGNGYIDPDLFIDASGKAYLYISVDSPNHTISVIPMKPDLLHAAAPRTQLFGLSQQWEHGQNFSTVEGPFVIRHGALYYLFYSGNDWNGNYAMGYATSRAPLGPFTKCACNPVLRGTKDILGPGGGSIVQGPDNADWLVFHAWDDGGAQGYQSSGIRTMLLEPITWHGSRAIVARPTNAPRRAP